MPTSLDFDAFVAAFDLAAESLAVSAEIAGLDAPVITCGAWRMRDLVAHQGKIHRWANARIGGSISQSAATSDRELVGWYREGFEALRATMVAAPADLAAATFLEDAPPAKMFWARRQAHETSIHCVDAFAATIGRLPTTDECQISLDFAVDGIDELILGFIPRDRTRLRSPEPYSILVEPSDSPRRWKLEVGPESVITSTVDVQGPSDAVISGSAAALYLGLWNRGDEVEFSGRAGVLDEWRQLMCI